MRFQKKTSARRVLPRPYFWATGTCLQKLSCRTLKVARLAAERPTLVLDTPQDSRYKAIRLAFRTVSLPGSHAQALEQRLQHSINAEHTLSVWTHRPDQPKPTRSKLPRVWERTASSRIIRRSFFFGITHWTVDCCAHSASAPPHSNALSLLRTHADAPTLSHWQS